MKAKKEDDVPIPDPLAHNYHADSWQKVIKDFDGHYPSGLKDNEVSAKRVIYGFNEMLLKSTPKWLIFLKQFNNVIIYILIMAALLTLLMRHYSDATVIGLVVIINALIGYFQEINASNALEKIKNMLSVEATVIRNGNRFDIPSRNLVPGDLVYLEAGDNVPADLRIMDADNLRIQESSLTGESDSVLKSNASVAIETPLAERVNMAYATTAVTNGSATGIVTATGLKTEIGLISQSVSDVKDNKSPLTKELDTLGRGISWFIIGVAVITFVLGWVMNVYTLPVLVMAIITMIVGSMPEGLPAATSVILATGVQALTKKSAIVKTLPAAETLGAVDIIASDKTGTLTKNEMTLQDIVIGQTHYRVTGTGYAPNGQIFKNNLVIDASQNKELEMFLTMGQQANDTFLVPENDQWQINGEPTDAAFLSAYYKAFGQKTPKLKEIDRIPFDSDYRYMARLVENQSGHRFIAIKGAPDKLFELASHSKNFDRDYWLQLSQQFAKTGKRVIAVGYHNVASDEDKVTHELLSTTGITFLGLAAIIDPPRPEVVEAIKDMRHAGIRVKMITGDSSDTAMAIGRQLGLAHDIKAMTGVDVDALNDQDLAASVTKYDVFARTTPQNKLRIVQAFQANGLITAMTGDGVNDAPALKKADIGVAMGIKGTDVAKDSADMVLANDNFSTIKTAIEQGRRLYDNIRKTILFLLPTSFAEGLIVVMSIFLQQPMPLTPTQLLWINMVSAITIQLAFIFEPAEPGLMNRPPRKTSAKLMNRHDIFQMTYVSVLIAATGLAVFEALGSNVSFAVASTMVVNIIIFGKIFYLFNIRTEAPVLSRSLWSNPMAVVAVGLMIVLQIFFTYVPFMQNVFSTAALSWFDWLIVILTGTIVLVITEIHKYFRLRKQVN
ncbi:HAD-IC family P-type ATPase [Leuconostoc gelidum subsp. gelidum]|uniref:HAD-IC family P-type ATPase n=1 Tax=Leuconostoc gelidum subsp. gelidum TaxID=1607839 RepID=A0AB35FZG1_LEUGE|nr:HAD-IC family P-type ATPase [Leuconostoc gelidum]MBZ5963537.1 HAD-IC family P-type ATPase [Leuconostoc gelidum subsp. gelidum]MBZ5975621.1 HAD-IC family P-type ATPase [Leuconostoc gelidum subsp. gelidum]MBZ5976211.1 HAD-IC family P-type ATPase [Leuconostoc gelidum subsp. gelidum]MBZ5986994.1 HAD-IC family P-type ATPase [Leuconostoc gelidum subsp. gelidum]MBZ6000112.1 HAD-IC family P-type ATPase [Leuconostoc gelidum subsp. gelidum]